MSKIWGHNLFQEIRVPLISFPVLSDSAQPSAAPGYMILPCDRWRFGQQGFGFFLCFEKGRRWGIKTIPPVRPTRRREDSRAYLCMLAVHPLLPSLGSPFRPLHCPQGRSGSAFAGCCGSIWEVSESLSPLQGLGGGQRCSGGQESSPS